MASFTCSDRCAARKRSSVHPRLADPRSETAPSDAGDGAEVVNAALGIIRVVNEHRSAAKVHARHRTVVPTVDGIVPVIAHHEEFAAGHDEGPPPTHAAAGHQ